MESNQNLLNDELKVDGSIMMHLKETANWARFLGILGFILSGLLAIIALALPAYMDRMGGSYRSYSYNGDPATMKALITVIYLVCAAILFIVAMFTFKFGSKVKDALFTGDQAALDTGMKNLKFLFRFYGIVAIIYIVFIILAILGGIASGSYR